MKRNVNKLIKYDNYYHLRRKNTVMEGRFAGRTWKLAGIAKFVLQLGQQSKTREETKNMLSQMNYRKETQPHGDELFPLSIHVFETDLQSTVRVYCQ